MTILEYDKFVRNFSPADWKVFKLSDLFEFQLGMGISRGEFSEDGIACLHYGDIHSNEKTNLDFATAEDYLPKFNGRIKSTSLLKNGDLVLVDASEDRVGTCKSIYIKNVDNYKFVSGLHTIIISTKKSEIYDDYKEYITSISYLKKQIMNMSQGTKVYGINTNNLGKLIIAIPPLEEQKKIAKILEAINKRINLKKQILKKEIIFREKLQRKTMSSYLNNQKRRELNEFIEEGLITIGRGKVISKNDMENKEPNYPIYSSSIQNGGFFGKYDLFMFDEELITWSIDGGGNFFYRDKHKFSITNVCGYIRVNDSTKIIPKFLELQLSYLHKNMKFDYSTKAHPSVIKKLYKLYFPDIKEQALLSNLFILIDKKIDLLNQEMELLENQKKGLMQQLLTGLIRVNVDEQ